MIPCAKTCPYYREGCHKTCNEWPRQIAKTRAETVAKNAWLKAQNRLSFDFVRSLQPISGCKSHY